mgnify:CR=1 FL=1
MTCRRSRIAAAAAWAVVLATLGALAAAAVAWSLGAGYHLDDGDAVPPATGPVVLVGLPGLSWDDAAGAGSPTLDGLARSGATANLVVRGAHLPTTPEDGWLTLGAGERAAADGQDAPELSEEPLRLEPAEGGGVTVPDLPAWQSAADSRPLEARLGSLASGLAEAGECVAAYGPRAALGAADPQGRVTAYRDLAGTGWVTGLEDACRVHLVDGEHEPEALEAHLAALTHRLPDDAVLLVAGIGDAGERSSLHAVVLQAPGTTGALSSAGTRQTGLVQTTDLTATLLHLVGAPVPGEVAGGAVRVSDADPEQRARADADLGAGATAAQALAAPFFLVLAALLLPVLAVSLVRRARRATAVTATAALAVPAATSLAGLVPWWRGSPPLFALVATVVVVSGVLVALAWAGPWRRHPLLPPMLLAAVTVVVLGADVITGGRLGLTSMLGVQPIVAGRFYGTGNVGAGLLTGAALVLGGFAASVLWPRRLQATLAVLLLGGAVVAVEAVPVWGADFGGVPTMVAATAVLALGTSGLRVTPLRAVGVVAATALVAVAALALDWLRPADRRSHLGAFAQSVLDGDGLAVVLRKLDQSLGILVSYPASWLAVLLLAVIVWALARPRSRAGRVLEPLWQQPLLRATAWALLVSWVVGWALNDSGVALAGTGMWVGVSAGLAVAARVPGARPGTAGRGAGSPASPAR